MSQLTPNVVRTFLLKKYETGLLDHGLTVENVPENFDLFAEGIIDSMGVLNMISDVENEFGVTLDMEKLDAEQLTIVDAFCRYVAENCQPSGVEVNGNSTNGHALNQETVQADMRNFIRQNYSIAADDGDFTDDVHLYNAGYIDTMGVGTLRKFIESKFAVQMTPADLSTVPMNTVRELSDFVMKRRNGKA